MSKKIYNNFFSEEIWKDVNQDNKDLLDDFLLELKQLQRSEQTIYQYKRDIMGIFCYIYQYLDNKYILYLTKRDFRRYSLYLTQECEVSNARHNRLLSALRSMLDFAEESDDIYDYDINVAKKVGGLPRESVRDIIFLTDEQIFKLIEELIKFEDYQKAALLALAYDSCGRKGELVQVEKCSFMDASKNNTNRVRGKGGKVFTLIYFDLTKRCAKLWLEQRGEDDVDSMWVVGINDNKHGASRKNVYDWFLYMREMLENMENKDIPFNVHSMRHSGLQNYSDGTHYVCKLLNNDNGFPIEKLKILVNHSDISTTSSYLKDDSVSALEDMFNITINA